MTNSATHWTLDHIREMDARDPLADRRDLFAVPENIFYLDGNSLGALPRATPGRIAEVIEKEWGEGLIRSWNQADWINLPARVGAMIAPLIGAETWEVVAADSTSVNLFKMVAAACAMRPGRRKIITETGNFPTDLYVMQGLESLLDGVDLVRVGADDIFEALDEDTAVLSLTHVNYRDGTIHDMAALTKRAQAMGALTVWDLSHTAGAMPVDLNDAGADFAVGCGYKYLNGGPGAPAFLFVADRHQEEIDPPLSGWMGHARPFDFAAEYEPAEGIARNLCGTPAILGLAALEAGLETFSGVDMDAIRVKSMALGDLFIDLVEQMCGDHNFTLACGRDCEKRGSQVSLHHADGYAIMQALIARGIIGDFRAPDVMRFGMTPLYLRYRDIWDAVSGMAEIMDGAVWRDPAFSERAAVT
ncbi:MAG: kynureninase [Proteobacteria bacterium]|nr:kynureninase [Pseudomonadota bacterium]